MSNITPNQREAIAAIDDLSGDTFYVGGNAADKSINVNITGDIVVGDINLTEVGGAAISLGQKTSANSLPITIASNQSTLSVSDSAAEASLSSIDSKTPALGQALAASSVPVVLTAAQISTLTPLSTVAATQSGNWSTRTLDGSGNSVGSTGGALNVNISSGNITGFATSSNQTNGTQLTQIVDAGGDAVTVTGGKLDVNATISGSGGGTSSIDKSAFTVGSDTGTPVMGIYQSVLDTVTTGDVAVAGLTPKRGLFVNLQTAAGAEAGVAASPLQVSLANTAANSTAVKVDGTGGTFPATQSGTWNITNISGTISLPTGAATASNQTGGGQKTQIVDGSGNVIGSTSNALDINIKSGNPTSIAVTQSTSPWIVAGGGTAGTAASGVITVQGIASMTPIQVSQATASNLNATVVQGTATNLKTAATLYNSSGTEIGTTTNPVAVQPPASGYLSTNLTNIAGNAVSAGNGTSGTGVLRVTVASDSTGQVAPAANATATGTAIYNNTALSSTKQAVNASAGNLYGYHVYNPNSSVVYIQMFNLASASVTVGSTAPTAVIAVPAGGWADATPATPIAFGTALTIAATTTSTGSGAPTTALLFNAWYK